MTGTTGNATLQTLKIPVYVTREQLQQFRKLAKKRGIGITGYMQWVLTEHLNWNGDDLLPRIEALTMHKGIEGMIRWNDHCIERHLGRAKRPVMQEERRAADRELQMELDVGGR